MQIDWWTLALQTVNFAVLVWLLNRFLYKPVLRMIDARQSEIDGELAKAGAAQADAEKRLAEIQAEREGIAAERATMLSAAAGDAEKEAAARRERAEKEADALLDETRKRLEREREAALEEVRRAALDLGIDIAERLLDQIPVELRAEAWLERIEAHFAGMPEAERKEIDRGLGEGVRIVTASPMSAEEQGVWRERLGKALGQDVEMSFDVDEALIAGAELHFANAILRFSWREALAAMREEVEERRGDAD